MRGDKLTISHSDSDRCVWLVIDSPPLSHREGIWLREGFSVRDVYAAIEATGWAQRHGDAWQMLVDIRCELLRNVVEEMFTYFQASDLPTPELLTVQSGLAAYCMDGAMDAVPLLACAWLDVMVRDDIADKARSVKNVWSEGSISIDCEALCERRAMEVLARFASAQRGITGKLAPSTATRTGDWSRTIRGA
jgi:hypothetical protein